MKIAIVQEHIDARRGGAETSTLEMARQLARLGHSVTVVCRTADAPGELPDAGSGTLTIRSLQAGSRRNNLAVTRNFIEQAAALAAEFDIVHAVIPCPTATIYQPRGGTYVETIRRSIEHSPAGWRRIWRALGRRLNRRQQYLLNVERELLARAKPPLIAAVSDYVRRQVQTDYPKLPSGQTVIVFNGVDVEPLNATDRARRRTAWREKLRIGPDEPFVLFVAHNFKLKGLAELIRATAIPGERSWKAVVVGRDSPGPFQRLARRLGVSARFRFCGPSADIPGLLAAADMLAHPTWYDPCSRVVLEAVCHGVPALTTRYNGAAEIIVNDRNGTVIDRPEPTLIALGIERCLVSRLAATALADASTARERLSMARHARELMALYGLARPLASTSR